MTTIGQSDSGRARPLIYQRATDGNANIEEITGFLKETIPNHWQTSLDIARHLATKTEFVSWQDRATEIDAMVWERARLMLSNDQITTVINRLNHSHGRCYAVADYAMFVGSTIAAVLTVLDQDETVSTPHHAITCALSKSSTHQAQAKTWLSLQNSIDPCERILCKLPGYSFALMTVYDNDTAESFMARDAFWRAMLGG